MADLTDEINKSSREFSETTKKFNAEFKSLIGNVRDVNQSLGDSFADLRKDQANTFAGALQAKKTKEILKEFDKVIEIGRKTLKDNVPETYILTAYAEAKNGNIRKSK